jgi:hypothetical protein
VTLRQLVARGLTASFGVRRTVEMYLAKATLALVVVASFGAMGCGSITSTGETDGGGGSTGGGGSSGIAGSVGSGGAAGASDDDGGALGVDGGSADVAASDGGAAPDGGAAAGAGGSTGGVAGAMGGSGGAAGGSVGGNGGAGGAGGGLDWCGNPLAPDGSTTSAGSVTGGGSTNVAGECVGMKTIVSGSQATLTCPANNVAVRGMVGTTCDFPASLCPNTIYTGPLTLVSHLARAFANEDVAALGDGRIQLMCFYANANGVGIGSSSTIIVASSCTATSAATFTCTK